MSCSGPRYQGCCEDTFALPKVASSPKEGRKEGRAEQAGWGYVLLLACPFKALRGQEKLLGLNN